MQKQSWLEVWAQTEHLRDIKKDFISGCMSTKEFIRQAQRYTDNFDILKTIRHRKDKYGD